MARKPDDQNQQMLFGDTPVRQPKRKNPPPTRPEQTVVHTEPDLGPEEEERTCSCTCCLHVTQKLKPHRVDSSKVRTLLDMELLERRRLDRVRRGEDVPESQMWVFAEEGRDLVVRDVSGEHVVDSRTTPYRASQHAARLYWFGLLDRGPRRSGAFRINENGRRFLAGELAVPPRIWCFNGKVIEKDEGSVTIHEVKHVVLSAEYWDGYGEWMRYRGAP